MSPPSSAGSVAGPALGLLTVAVGLAVAGRWGMLPFHVRVSRLTDLVPPETLPLLLAWIAVPLTVVAFAAVDRLIAPLALPLAGERTVLVVLAVLTLVGASLAAWLHDDIRRVTGYLVVADSGLLLLAIAAMDPAAWGPGRAWVIVLAASKSALAAWAAVTEDRFETRSVPDLRGWARRSPLLALALAITALATFGLPGWVAFDSRSSLATLVAEEPWSGLLLLAGFLTLPTYLRLLAVGAGRVTSRVDRTAPERMGRRRRQAESLPVELEGCGDRGGGHAGVLRRAGRRSRAASRGRAGRGGRGGRRGRSGTDHDRFGDCDGGRGCRAGRARRAAARRRVAAEPNGAVVRRPSSPWRSSAPWRAGERWASRTQPQSRRRSSSGRAATDRCVYSAGASTQRSISRS